MFSEKERALLGDREAQEAITARGELLPCPFCGADAMIEYDTINPFEYAVFCGDCGVMTTTSEDENIARREWNHRAPLLTPTQMALLGIAREPRKFEGGL